MCGQVFQEGGGEEEEEDRCLMIRRGQGTCEHAQTNSDYFRNVECCNVGALQCGGNQLTYQIKAAFFW